MMQQQLNSHKPQPKLQSKSQVFSKLNSQNSQNQTDMYHKQLLLQKQQKQQQKNKHYADISPSPDSKQPKYHQLVRGSQKENLSIPSHYPQSHVVKKSYQSTSNKAGSILVNSQSNNTNPHSRHTSNNLNYKDGNGNNNSPPQEYEQVSSKYNYKYQNKSSNKYSLSNQPPKN